MKPHIKHTDGRIVAASAVQIRAGLDKDGTLKDGWSIATEADLDALKVANDKADAARAVPAKKVG